MKNLEVQIKFIDTKLLPIYGFKNIIDYAFILCISDLDNLKIDLDKLNSLIDEFRKVFHSKNFSLHKTQYKILTKSQAICLLKTCLETTSIPFDISLKKNKKFLRLISKNNILENYINTLKMAENRSFNENSNLVNPIISDCKNTIYPGTVDKTESNNSIPIVNNNQTKNDNYYTYNNGYKKIEEIKIINKEQLNNGIKKINNIEFYLSPKKLIKSVNFNISVIKIDMKKYDLDDKILKSFCVKFISKKINDQPIIAESFIEHLIKNIEFEVKIGNNYPYNWTGKFTNGINCIVDNILLPNKCLTHHSSILKLINIDDILYLLENLEIKVTCEFVSLYTELDNILNKSLIEQLICVENKYNIFRIIYGMGSNTYSEFLNLKKFNKLQHRYDLKNNDANNDDDNNDDANNGVNKIELNKNDIINESNLFVGNPLTFDEIEGFEIKNYSKDFINEDSLIALEYKYYFVCWDIFYDLKTNGIEYYKIKIKNTCTHCYKINILNYENIPHSISKLKIMSNFNVNKILKTSINFYCGEKRLDLSVKYNFDNGVLELDLENKHLILIGKIDYISIEFESVGDEELVGEKLSILMKGFNWIDKYRLFLITNKMNIIDPNTIYLEHKKQYEKFRAIDKERYPDQY